MEKYIKVFESNKGKHIGNYTIEETDNRYGFWRSNGYGVRAYEDGDVSIDNERPDDDGRSYLEQLKEFEKTSKIQK